jgi:hypothetical protein
LLFALYSEHIKFSAAQQESGAESLDVFVDIIFHLCSRLDDNPPQKIPTYISEQDINPWREEMNEQYDVVHQSDGIIEIESSAKSDSDVHPHDCISILSGDGKNDAMDTGDLTAEFDDDDESIDLKRADSSFEQFSVLASQMR